MNDQGDTPSDLLRNVSAEFEVGYRKPPVASRFKPGRSGNPGGRPKRPSMNGAFDRVANRMLTVRQGGRKRRMIAVEAFLLGLMDRALKGDRVAEREMCRLIGARGVTAVGAVPGLQASAPVIFTAVFPPGRDEGD